MHPKPIFIQKFEREEIVRSPPICTIMVQYKEQTETRKKDKHFEKIQDRFFFYFHKNFIELDTYKQRKSLLSENRCFFTHYGKKK